MSRRKSSSSNSKSSAKNNTEKEKVTFPESCLVCDNDIESNSVLFHCECVVALCSDCAINQVAFQQTTFHKGILCPYCRKPSDNMRGVEDCKKEEDDLINRAIEFYKIRISRNDDGIRKTLISLINDGLDMGSSSLAELEVLDTAQVSAPLPLRLELARLEYAREQRAVKKKYLSAQERKILPLGPLLKLSIARNHILERAIEMQRATSRISNRDQYKRKFEDDDDSNSLPPNKATRVSTKNAEIPPPMEENDTDSIQNDDEMAQDEVLTSNEATELSNQTDRMDSDQMDSKYADDMNNYSDDEMTQGKRHIKIKRVKLPKIPPNAPVVISSGNLSGIRGTCVGYTNSGESVRVEFVDTNGRVKRTAILRKNVSLFDDFIPKMNEDKKSKKVYCICGKPQSGVYVKCQLGISGCNGWVHPRCCADLQNLSFEELQIVDSIGYECLFCKRYRDDENIKNSENFSASSKSKPQPGSVFENEKEKSQPSVKIPKAVSKSMIGSTVFLASGPQMGSEATVVDVSEYGLVSVKVLDTKSPIEPPALYAPYVAVSSFVSKSSEENLLTDQQDNKLDGLLSQASAVESCMNENSSMYLSSALFSKPVAKSEMTVKTEGGPDKSSGMKAGDEMQGTEHERNSEVSNWAMDLAFHLPGLVGEVVKRPVPFTLVKALWDRMNSLNISPHDAFATNLAMRLTAFIKCIERLDQTVHDDLEKVRAVLELQDGKMENDIHKRNLMEKKLGQLLNVTYESHTKIGVRCPSLQIILRVLAWCNTVYYKLFHGALSADDRRDVITQSDEFLQSAKRMPVVETFLTVWKKQEADIQSKAGQETSNTLESSIDDSHPNHCILIILAYILDYWRRYVVSLGNQQGENTPITTYLDSFNKKGQQSLKSERSVNGKSTGNGSVGTNKHGDGDASKTNPSKDQGTDNDSTTGASEVVDLTADVKYDNEAKDWEKDDKSRSDRFKELTLQAANESKIESNNRGPDSASETISADNRQSQAVADMPSSMPMQTSANIRPGYSLESTYAHFCTNPLSFGGNGNPQSYILPHGVHGSSASVLPSYGWGNVLNNQITPTQKSMLYQQQIQQQIQQQQQQQEQLRLRHMHLQQQQQQQQLLQLQSLSQQSHYNGNKLKSMAGMNGHAQTSAQNGVPLTHLSQQMPHQGSALNPLSFQYGYLQNPYPMTNAQYANQLALAAAVNPGNYNTSNANGNLGGMNPMLGGNINNYLLASMLSGSQNRQLYASATVNANTALMNAVGNLNAQSFVEAQRYMAANPNNNGSSKVNIHTSQQRAPVNQRSVPNPVINAPQNTLVPSNEPTRQSPSVTAMPSHPAVDSLVIPQSAPQAEDPVRNDNTDSSAVETSDNNDEKDNKSVAV